MPEAVHDSAIPAIQPAHGASVAARFRMRLPSFGPAFGPASVVAGTLVLIEISVPGDRVHGMTVG